MSSIATVNWPAMTIADAHTAMTAPGAVCETEQRIIFGVRRRVWKHAPPTLRQFFAGGQPA